MHAFITRKLLPVILSLFLVTGIFAAAVFAEGEVTYNVSTAAELSSAVNAINASSGGNFIINLTGNITMTDSIAFRKSGTATTIIGNNYSVSFTSWGAYITVDRGAELTLGDGLTELTLVGRTTTNNPGLIYIYEAPSTVNMLDKVTIKDNVTTTYYGGGVTVEGGTFHMYGGTIENCGISRGSVCFGGGVAVYGGGTFIMDDGLISECFAHSDFIDADDPNRCFTAMGGGVFVTGGSLFEMNGGVIENCDATNFGGGVALDTSYDELLNAGGQFGYLNSAFVMNGGTIDGNTADSGAGVFASAYIYNLVYALATDNPAIGDTVSPGLHINGGTISNNEAADMGGGVLVMMMRPAIAANIHNALITGNTAANGAGIEIYGYWTQTDIDGCTITDNVSTGTGGGLLMVQNMSGGKTTLKDTTITGNTSGEIGAGVYYDVSSQFLVAGATVIQNNTFDGKLNNLNVLSTEALPMVGDLTGASIGLSDPALWGDEYEDTDPDAQSSSFLTGGFLTNNAELASVFTSDHPGWVVAISDVDANEVRLVRIEPVEYIEEITIDKTYFGKEGYDDEDEAIDTEEYFTETVEFTIEPFASFNRETGKTVIPAFAEASYEITVGDGSDTVTVELPDFTDAGLGDYWYKLTEVEGDTAGVTYDTEYYLHIVVTADNPYDVTDIGVSQVTMHKTAPDTTDGSYENTEADKAETLSNIYGHGDLTVRNEVTGNMADLAKRFDVIVVFTAPGDKVVMGPITYGTETIEPGWKGTSTVTVTLGHNEEITFENIPDGVTYKVVEVDYSSEGYEIPYYVFDKPAEEGDVVIDSRGWADTYATGTISDSKDKVTITNVKNAELDVGVIIQSKPFIFMISASAVIMILAAAVLAGSKRRRDSGDID